MGNAVIWIPIGKLDVHKIGLFLDLSCAILSSFQIVVLFNDTSAEKTKVSWCIIENDHNFVELRISQKRSKNKQTLIDSLFQGFVTVNGKAVKKADLQADNGVIHFVSEMLEPMVTEDIPAVLTSDGRFGTLLTAIEMAGLGEMLTQSTNLYIPSTINIGKKLLSTALWADKIGLVSGKTPCIYFK